MKQSQKTKQLCSARELSSKARLLWPLLLLAFLGACSQNSDSRASVRVPVHLYNSSGKDIQVTVAEKNAPEEKRLKWNILMPPGVGREVQITRADTYTFKVTEDEKLNYTFEVTEDFKEAVLLDFGSKGQFKLAPVFYKGEGLSDDEAEKKVSTLIQEKGLETIFITKSAPFHKLPVRPDIGLSSSAMLVEKSRERKSVYHQWQLTTMRSGLGW